MTALVGHSGAGKSTILNLIPRFYNAKSGDIKIDNQSIYKTSLYSLRKNISLVSQDTTLFDDTIKNNIAYANLDASHEEIYKLLNTHLQMNLLKNYLINMIQSLVKMELDYLEEKNKDYQLLEQYLKKVL